VLRRQCERCCGEARERSWSRVPVHPPGWRTVSREPAAATRQ
jgi:hypothetical protein